MPHVVPQIFPRLSRTANLARTANLVCGHTNQSQAAVIQRYSDEAAYVDPPLQQSPERASMMGDTTPSRCFTNEPNGGSLLYTHEQRLRRDRSSWTLVQGVLAPVQFAIFLTSLVLVLRFLATGDGFSAATISIVIKTLALYTIMITGAIWEREVFGCYLFARSFFWEDVFSMLVIALHTAYIAALWSGRLAPHALMMLALAAYATYIINAAQFILKLRRARLQRVPALSTLAGVAS